MGFSGHLPSFYHGLLLEAVVFLFWGSAAIHNKVKGHRSMRAGSKVQRIAALEVFVGGACYGANATMYKLAYGDGFTWPQVVGCQMWFAAALFGIAVIASCFLGKPWAFLNRRVVLRLMGLGALSCMTAILYCFAMSRLPVAVALTLLFQFTWIGLVIQTITTRRPPRPIEAIAVIVILVGTVLASGAYEVDMASYDVVGLIAAFMSAVSCALFVTMSGRVKAPCSSAQRGLIVCLGSCLASLIVCPDFLTSGVVFSGLAPYGLVVGFFGMLLPVLLFGLGSPNLPAGISTVLAASELPSGMLVSVMILGESVEPLQWIGVAVILLGVAASQSGCSKTAARSEAPQHSC